MVVVVAMLIGCDDEVRLGRGTPPPGGERTLGLRTSDLQAGVRTSDPDVANPYAGNTFAIQEGQRLFGWYNCAGCHGGLGGGAIGPPLRNQSWLYGGAPGNVFQSIVLGRPQGMPAYAGKITDDHVWKIVAFIQSLGGMPEPGPDPVDASQSGGEIGEPGADRGPR